jgi:hypothetical protein
MIHRFTTSITHAKTLINRYHYFNKVVKGQNLSQRCSPHKEGHFLGYCSVPNTFPWEMPLFSTSQTNTLYDCFLGMFVWSENRGGGGTASISHLSSTQHYFNKVVDGQNHSQRCSPHKERHFLWYCSVPNTFPWELPQFSTSQSHKVHTIAFWVCLFGVKTGRKTRGGGGGGGVSENIPTNLFPPKSG